MTHASDNSEPTQISQEPFEQMVRERLRQGVRQVLIDILEEVTAIIGARPYERCESRRDQRNGYYQRSLETTVGEIMDLPVPRTRGGHQTQVFQRYHRRRDELDAAMMGMLWEGSVRPKSERWSKH